MRAHARGRAAPTRGLPQSGVLRVVASEGGGGAEPHGVLRRAHRSPPGGSDRRCGAASLRSARRLRAGALYRDGPTKRGPPAHAPSWRRETRGMSAHSRGRAAPTEGPATVRLTLWRERGLGRRRAAGRTTQGSPSEGSDRRGAASLLSARCLRAGARCQRTAHRKGPPARAPSWRRETRVMRAHARGRAAPTEGPAAVRPTLWRELGRKAHHSATRRRGAGSLRSAHRLRAGARCQTTAPLKGGRPLARLAAARDLRRARTRARSGGAHRGACRGATHSVARAGSAPARRACRGACSRAYLAARDSSS